jgi:uncharacterized iron-regulated membrane protein
MTSFRRNSRYLQSIRRLHRQVAPVMLLPLFLTASTGTIYQIIDLAGKDNEFGWVLDWHKGHFGLLNLEVIYPFLNALGLLTLIFTGISMWLNFRHTSRM